MNCYLLISSEDNVYFNIALEKTLTDWLPKNSIALMLWQNDKCVVIGKNQCAQVECDLAAMEENGIKLARRLSGGGAVYHDKNNLNFTFAASPEIYDVSRQLGVVEKAINSLGFNCTRSGRNDITIDGRKFSGNAFLREKNAYFHHGTILIDTNTSMLSKSLTVNKQKLQSNGVASVVSRIVNLKELNQNISVQDVKNALTISFQAEYGNAEELLQRQFAVGANELAKKLGSQKWLLGENIKLSNNIITRFNWGLTEIWYDLAGGVVKNLKIYSDALDVEGIEQAQQKLCGANIDSFVADTEIQRDISQVIKNGR